MKKSNVLVAFLLLFCLTGYAQSDSDLFNEAKKYFKSGKYDLASDLFARVAKKNKKEAGAYASFYLGMSHFKAGRIQKAKDVWLELDYLKPDWSNKEELYFWISTAYMQLDNTVSGERYVEKISDSKIKKDVDFLVTEKEEVPDTKSEKINLEDSVWLSNFLVEAMDKNYSDREIASLLEIPKATVKNNYKVAVLLPFMFESLTDPAIAVSNGVIMGMYQGIVYGIDKLRQEGYQISLFPYDTKKSGDQTTAILSKPELKSMDFIIGPLYEDPSKITADFCFKNKIPQLNLLSTDAKQCKFPYTFYYHPSRNTLAENVFKYIQEQEDLPKTATIFFQNTEKDKEIAKHYKKLLLDNGYTINAYEGFEKEEAQKIAELISETGEIVIPETDLATIDSIKLYHPEILLNKRKTYGAATNEYYYDRILMTKEQIGHVFISSSSSSFGATVVSALEIRDDGVLVIGNEKWLEPKVVNMAQLEKKNVLLTNPAYVDDEEELEKFTHFFISKFKNVPSSYAVLSFEATYVFGKALTTYGRNFSPKLLTVDRIKGCIYSDLEFNYHPDNQYVPIVKLENAKLVKVN